MAQIGGCWVPTSWHVDAWGAGTWGDAVVPVPPGPTAAGGGMGVRKRKKQRYMLEESLDPSRPLNTRIVPYSEPEFVAPAQWTPEVEEEDDSEMLEAVAAFLAHSDD